MLRKGGTKTRGAMAPRYVRLQTTGFVRHRTYAGGTHQSSITWPTLPDTVLLFPFRQPHLPYRPLPRGWYGLGGGAAAVAPVASSSVKASPHQTLDSGTQDPGHVVIYGSQRRRNLAFSSKMSGRLRGREILRPFRDKCVQFRLPLGWNRPSGVDSAGLLGVDSALWGGLGRSPPFRLNPSRHFEWAILSQGVPSGSGVVHCV